MLSSSFSNKFKVVWLFPHTGPMAAHNKNAMNRRNLNFIILIFYFTLINYMTCKDTIAFPNTKNPSVFAFGSFVLPPLSSSTFSSFFQISRKGHCKDTIDFSNKQTNHLFSIYTSENVLKKTNTQKNLYYWQILCNFAV